MASQIQQYTSMNPQISAEPTIATVEWLAAAARTTAHSDTRVNNPTSSERSIRLALPSTMHAVYVVNAVICEIVREMQFDEDKGEDVILAVTEAGTNAIRHGNKEDANKYANFEFILGPDQLTIVVEDQGQGFERKDVPDPLRPENMSKGSGRGLFLMEACMDVVTYNARGTKVRMVKYSNPPSPPVV